MTDARLTDARAALASLRPQPFGRGRPDAISDPIVEPLWAGIRALAAVDGTGALIVDELGTPIEDQPEVVGALPTAVLSDGLVLDGFLTKQAANDGVGVVMQTADLPSVGSSVGHFFFGSRRNRAAEAAEAREQQRQLETLGPEDTVAYVAIDLLWLDGESLLDVPLLERRRLLDAVVAESQVVRRGAYVRPPIAGWIRSWRAQGFVGLMFRAANSRYEPGVASSEWTTTPMPR